MTQAEAASLKTCNGMGDLGNGNWVPYRREADAYYSPDGLKVYAPYRWQSLTYPELVATFGDRDRVSTNESLS